MVRVISCAALALVVLGFVSMFGGLLVGVWADPDLMDKLVPTGLILALVGGGVYMGVLETR